MLTAEPKIRLFVAVDPPEEARDILAATIDELDGAIPDKVRWVKPHRIHLTVKFLGDVYESLVDDILTTLQQASKDFQGGRFQLSLSRLGVFPDQRRPRVLWAGVQGNTDQLENLHLTVDQSLSKLGFSLDKSPYRPHLTLGRTSTRGAKHNLALIGGIINEWQPLKPITWEVESFRLVHSVLEPGKTEYITLGTTLISSQNADR